MPNAPAQLELAFPLHFQFTHRLNGRDSFQITDNLGWKIGQLANVPASAADFIMKLLSDNAALTAAFQALGSTEEPIEPTCNRVVKAAVEYVEAERAHLTDLKSIGWQFESREATEKALQSIHPGTERREKALREFYQAVDALKEERNGI